MPLTDISFRKLVVRMLAPMSTFFLARAPAVASAVHTSCDPTVLRQSWLDRLEQRHWQQRQRALEARLADATNVADLEARIREIGRGFPSPYY